MGDEPCNIQIRNRKKLNSKKEKYMKKMTIILSLILSSTAFAESITIELNNDPVVTCDNANSNLSISVGEGNVGLAKLLDKKTGLVHSRIGYLSTQTNNVKTFKSGDSILANSSDVIIVYYFKSTELKDATATVDFKNEEAARMAHLEFRMGECK